MVAAQIGQLTRLPMNVQAVLMDAAGAVRHPAPKSPEDIQKALVKGIEVITNRQASVRAQQLATTFIQTTLKKSLTDAVLAGTATFEKAGALMKSLTTAIKQDLHIAEGTIGGEKLSESDFSRIMTNALKITVERFLSKNEPGIVLYKSFRQTYEEHRAKHQS